MSHPLVTIIIAVYNGADTLQRCIDSITAQTYNNTEVIVMDGGSTDGTLDIIKSNQEQIAYWESESDRGIYHAWNKALKHAHGEWICFLGADDYFNNEIALSSSLPYLIKATEKKIYLVYGQLIKTDIEGVPLKIVGKPWEKIKWQMRHGMALPHPGLFHHRVLFDRLGGFDERYEIAGDYEFLLRALDYTGALYSGIATVVHAEGGISSSRRLAALREVLLARQSNGYGGVTLLWLAVYIRALIRTQAERLFSRISR